MHFFYGKLNIHTIFFVKRNILVKSYIYFLTIGIIFLFSCSKETEKTIEREDLFSLSYGSFEDEFNISSLEEKNSNYLNSQIFMKDGFFYISVSNSKKVLKFTSFGDLLSIYYNPQYNVAPSRINEKKEEALSTLNAVEYPFNYPTLITVTDEKSLYVVDNLEEERLEYDFEEDIGLQNIVLHFNEKGEFIDYIGQEGYGGSPFPPIKKLFCNKNNEIVVICKVKEDMRLYYYNDRGILVHKYSIPLLSLPKIYKDESSVYKNIDISFPSFDKDIIYVKVDYYLEEIDPASNVRRGIEFDKSMLHIFDRKEKSYIKNIELPFYEDIGVIGGEQVKFKKIYELIDITKDEKCFFITPNNKHYALSIFDIKNSRNYKHNLDIPPFLYGTFCACEEDFLCALFSLKDKVQLSWWHTEKLIQK